MSVCLSARSTLVWMICLTWHKKQGYLGGQKLFVPMARSYTESNCWYTCFVRHLWLLCWLYFIFKQFVSLFIHLPPCMCQTQSAVISLFTIICSIRFIPQSGLFWTKECQLEMKGPSTNTNDTFCSSGYLIGSITHARLFQALCVLLEYLYDEILPILASMRTLYGVD